jgi:hypothetical protein
VKDARLTGAEDVEKLSPAVCVHEDGADGWQTTRLSERGEPASFVLLLRAAAMALPVPLSSNLSREAPSSIQGAAYLTAFATAERMDCIHLLWSVSSLFAHPFPTLSCLPRGRR